MLKAEKSLDSNRHGVAGEKEVTSVLVNVAETRQSGGGT